MKIFKMVPGELQNLQWQVSTYQGEVIIRAESEQRARDLLGYCFWKTGQSGSANMAGPPWNRSNLVDANEYTAGDFPTEGVEEILAPPEAVALWQDYKAENDGS